MFSVVAGVRKAAGRHIGCFRGTSGGWRWQLVVLAIVATAAAAALLAFFAPLRVAVWFSSPTVVLYSENVAIPEKSLLPSPPPPPPPVLNLSPSAAPATPAAFVAPSPSPVGNLEMNKGSCDKKISFLSPESSATEFLHVAPSSSPSSSPVESLRKTKANSTISAPSNTNSVDAIEGPSMVSHFPPPAEDFKGINASSPVTKVPPLRAEMPLWKMSIEQQLIYAKREIAEAPLILDDPDLHAPLFRNFSVFKRSYELMERILKVYIYKDGPVPLFHTPILGGIYSSEGWFMKLMEENKQFVVKDPSKAHLFYLAYSSQQLRTHLYVPDSHSFTPLSTFLRDYINLISAKYPFWNRTRGADHFLVACHDWAPYTTRMHPELFKNTIKAVCNADVSEHIFVKGKDVSLPETYIRTPKRPRKDIGGKPALKRSILAFYAGHMHGHVRPILLQHWKDKDKDMRIYETLPSEIAKKMSYIQHMKSSKFCICPRGYEVNSPRIVESIYYACVPVIIADHFVLPFEEVLDWTSFSIVIAEKDIPKLKEILLGVSSSQYRSMQMKVKRLQRHFLWNTKPRKYDLFHMILHSIWFNRLSQIPFRGTDA